LRTLFDVGTVGEDERAYVKAEMITLVSTLHEEHRVVHGDVKPDDFLRCRDGKLRLCDFDSARRVDDDEEGYEDMVTEELLAPNRDYHGTGRPPTISDDIYALGLSIWSLYTGNKVLENEAMEEVMRDKRTVDVIMSPAFSIPKRDGL